MRRRSGIVDDDLTCQRLERQIRRQKECLGAVRRNAEERREIPTRAIPVGNIDVAHGQRVTQIGAARIPFDGLRQQRKRILRPVVEVVGHPEDLDRLSPNRGVLRLQFHGRRQMPDRAGEILLLVVGESQPVIGFAPAMLLDPRAEPGDYPIHVAFLEEPLCLIQSLRIVPRNGRLAEEDRADCQSHRQRESAGPDTLRQAAIRVMQ